MKFIAHNGHILRITNTDFDRLVYAISSGESDLEIEAQLEGARYVGKIALSTNAAIGDVIRLLPARLRELADYARRERRKEDAGFAFGEPNRFDTPRRLYGYNRNRKE